MSRQGAHLASAREGRAGHLLLTERLGPLPIINHYLDRLGIDDLLRRFVPSGTWRTRLDPVKGILVLLRSMVVEREPIYRQAETTATFAPRCFGLKESDLPSLRDDAIGRALDRLFDADRGSLLTEVVARLPGRFEIAFDEIHNDTTTIRFAGQYFSAKGRSLRGKKAPWITYGFSKDHRPDLKQLVFLLSTSEDGGVPVQFRCENGNTNDAATHLETWEALRKATGRSDFLYVADCKLCDRETMKEIDAKKGRFITVIPRSRGEDTYFRKKIQDFDVPWTTVWDRPNPRGKYKRRDIWKVWLDNIPSREAWPVIWVFSSLLAAHHDRLRHEHIQKVEEELRSLQKRLLSKRRMRRTKTDIWATVADLLDRYHVTEYLKVRLDPDPEYRFRQIDPGRPGPQTRYRRITKRRWRLLWELDQKKIDYDAKSDGMYPLLTNDRTLTPRQVLEAHKRQPVLEKRFEQLKTVHEIAPVFLKNEGRIEAFFTLYFLALLVQALIERDLRAGMKQEGIESLPLYGEEMACEKPTGLQVLRLFSLAERHVLYRKEEPVDTFDIVLTPLQRQVLQLLRLPAACYRV